MIAITLGSISFLCFLFVVWMLWGRHPHKSVPTNRGAGHINRPKSIHWRSTHTVTKLTPPRYSATSIQKAWLGGVCDVDITALRQLEHSVEADFTYRGHELHATVNGYGCSEARIMKVLAANIEYVKEFALRSRPWT